MQRWVVISVALLALVGADECPDGGRCEDGQTCCRDPVNGYECCPFDKAECCGDHVHCCPEGTLCDLGSSSCWNSSGSVPWAERVSADQPGLSKSFRMIKAYMGEEDDNICPDQSRCPPEFSCLRALTKFGCCPLAQGVPCSDGKHCCPEGHQCSADCRSCIKKEVVTTVLCSDGVSECPDETTCCETPDGKWGCCPMPKAVCCEDKLHCCPEATTCDLKQSKCISSSTKKQTPMWGKLPARIRADWENQKEDEPVAAEKAVDGGSEKSPDVTTAKTVPPLEQEVQDVPCDDTSACPDNTTCCKTQEGGWACCPLPEAVCCEDFIHCCPKGKKCNLAAQKCDDATSSVPWFKKVPTVPRRPLSREAIIPVQDVPCDDTSACPDNTTCCKTQEGGWACCPLPEAVCCEDFIHCCPKGKKCNLAAQKCDDATSSVPWFKKVPAFPRHPLSRDAIIPVQDVPCDDTSACPDDTTCCKTQEGGWACCPMPEAVCCEDFIHCCPKGKKCNVAAQRCDDAASSVPWFKKVPAVPRRPLSQPRDVACDSTYSCPDGSTCCKTKTGDWACCPEPQAVCCDDHEHCCPSGTTCDLATLSCNGASGSMPMKQKIPAFFTAAPTTVTTKSPATTETDEKDTEKPTEAHEEDYDNDDEGDDDEEDKEEKGHIQCDSTTTCPDSTTCCFMSSTHKYGCCPLPHAVCCADGDHCCPTDYKCDETKTSCIREELVIPWYTKIPATTSVKAKPSSVHCDGQNQCPDHTTCCQLSTGEWGCCPLPNAVCCPDEKHCCPQGYTCNMASNSCQRVILLQLETLPLTPVFLLERQPQRSPPNHRDVNCDDTTSCKDGETCCRMSATQWGCCPLPNAVCCSDMMHCCPAGSTCTETGDCVQSARLSWQDWHMFLANKKRALVV